MGSTTKSSSTRFLLILALLLILGGGFLAHKIQTIDGIKVKDVRFIGANGKLVSALLYIPPGVTKEKPAPAIVATHGYINSRETQDGFAIEFARRGFVVLAPDQSGHGYSDPPAFGNGFGGMDALPFLRSLDIVDKNNIGLEGHSMGGWASLVAAAVYPDAYKSIVLASSSPGTYGTAEGTPTYPRNMALIYSLYDEFSQLMWGIPVPANIVKTDKLKKLFGTSEDVQVGKLYGSIQDGTARKMYQPPVIHPRTHLSTEAIGDAVEWMQTTLQGANGLTKEDQVWYWKEIGTMLALIGMVLLFFPIGQYLLGTNYFKDLNEPTPERKTISGPGWFIGALVTILLPIPLYMWMWNFHGQGILKACAFWPQQITTVIMFWAVTVAVISLVLFMLWHFLANKKTGANACNYGFSWKEGLQWGKLGKSFLLALIVVFAGYLTLVFSDWAFKTDYRFWVFAIKPMSLLQFGIFLAYLIPFTFYFLIAGLLLHGELRPGNGSAEVSMVKEMLINVLLMIFGYVLFLLYHYLPLFAGGSLGVMSRWAPLYGIVMFQFLPIFTIVALLSTYFFRKTGHVYVGAFANALVVTWIVVAGQATHFPY
jgi:pimeloyl-ACP methyl ester carboxylesterase